MQRLILVPFDLTPLGETRLPVIEEYAHALGAEVLLLHVLPPGTLDPGSVSPGEATARTYLDTLAAGLRGSGVRVETTLRGGTPAFEIVEEALSRNADLIVLGTNIRSQLSSAVLGSVADQVARAAPCPVLLVHPHGRPHRPRPLRDFEEDAERAGMLTQRNLGLRTIEINRIVGSVGRAKELGPDFRPPRRQRRKADEDRFGRVREALDSNISLPAIDVYKLGFGYYVLDGHHRVAAALLNAQVEIEANVVEFVPVSDEQAPELFAARREFERAVGLTEIGCARAESYRTLRETIERYCREQGMTDLDLAARRWAADVFRPLWQSVRARHLTSAFPGERSADVIARLAAWRQVEAPDLPWAEALDKFVSAQDLSGTSSSNSRNG